MIFRRQETSSLPSHQNLGPNILAELYTLFVITTALLATRGFVRQRITKDWGWDDAAIFVAWVFLLIGVICVQIAVNHGEGQHIQYLHDPEQQALELLKIDAFYQMDVVVCTLLTKISICLFILRIKNDKPLRWTFAISMTFMTLATLAVIIMECLACIPMRKLWEPETPGKCLPQIKVYTVAYVHSGLTILTDGALTLSPILILWKVQMKRERKILVSFLMSLGLVATLTNALRNYYQKGLTTPDFPYDMHTVLMLSILETGSGIIAACVPASSPIIRLFRRRRPTYTEDSYPMTRKIKSSTDDSNTWESSRHYDELSG